MHWAYVAGYFDGEGSVSMHKVKRGHGRGLTHTIVWINTHRGSLEAIQYFVKAGHIYERPMQPHQNFSSFVLQIQRRADVLRVLKAMLPHMIVKRAAAERLFEHVRDNVRDEAEGFGRVTATSTEQLVQWYEVDGLSCRSIADLLGVTQSAVSVEMKRRGIKRRPVGGSFHTKGVRKSAETIRRMKATRRKLWADPKFRERQRKLRLARNARKT